MKMGEWSAGVMEKWGPVFFISLQDVVYRGLSPILQYSNIPLILADQNLVVVE